MCHQHINLKCCSFLFCGSSWFLREPKLPTFCEMTLYIVFIKTGHWPLFRARWIHFSPTNSVLLDPFWYCPPITLKTTKTLLLQIYRPDVCNVSMHAHTFRPFIWKHAKCVVFGDEQYGWFSGTAEFVLFASIVFVVHCALCKGRNNCDFVNKE